MDVEAEGVTARDGILACLPRNRPEMMYCHMVDVQGTHWWKQRMG